MKAKTIEQLTKEFSAILQEGKPAFLRMFAKDVMGIECIVGNTDIFGNPTPGGKTYRTHGAGCSVSWMKGKGIKGKKYAEAADDAIYKFKEAIAPELCKLHPDAEVLPLLTQDITVNRYLQHQASIWFKGNNVDVRCVTRFD